MTRDYSCGGGPAGGGAGVGKAGGSSGGLTGGVHGSGGGVAGAGTSVGGAVGAGAGIGGADVGVAAAGADAGPAGAGGEYDRPPAGWAGAVGVAAGRGRLRTWLSESVAVVAAGKGVGVAVGDAGVCSVGGLLARAGVAAVVAPAIAESSWKLAADPRCVPR